MVLFIDNYDSFSYILLDYLKQLGLECRVVQNDSHTLPELVAMHPSAVVISPGPGTPATSGVVMDAIGAFHHSIPILGICLGHQAIGVHFGARLVRSNSPTHGYTSEVVHDRSDLFAGIISPFEVMRYHSLELEIMRVPDLVSTCTTHDGVNMGIRHRTLPITGFQFHPESIGTHYGLQLLRNWASGVSLKRNLKAGNASA
jgi:anthranilate synthase component II